MPDDKRLDEPEWAQVVRNIEQLNRERVARAVARLKEAQSGEEGQGTDG